MPFEIESVPLRTGTTAEWTAANIILGVGELGYNTTNFNLFVGDGVTVAPGTLKKVVLA
jgi:hypothetical protein